MTSQFASRRPDTSNYLFRSLGVRDNESRLHYVLWAGCLYLFINCVLRLCFRKDVSINSQLILFLKKNKYITFLPLPNKSLIETTRKTKKMHETKYAITFFLRYVQDKSKDNTFRLFKFMEYGLRNAVQWNKQIGI